MSLKELAPTYYTRLVMVLQEVGNPEKLFNAGCGDGFYDVFLKQKSKLLVSLDINKGDLMIAKVINPEKSVKYYLGKLEKLPFKSESFDTIICVEVLEHLKNDQQAINELVRVLKKKGKLIITVPSKNFPFVYDPINYILNLFRKKLKIGIWGWGHQRLYTFKALRKKIGLNVIKEMRLSHSLVGFFENGYINSFLQKFTKNDPLNQGKVSSNIHKIKKSVYYKPPRILIKIRDIIIKWDKFIFSRSKRSIGIMVVFKK